jgi:hypothetical protein
MPDADVIDEIDVLVRSGFWDRERLIEIICEELYAPGGLDPNAVEIEIDKQIATWEAAKETWPDVTDCDRLDTAFAALNERGVIALQNAGMTQSDGHSDFRQAYDDHHNKSSIVGYCFYHGQDLERAVRGGGLYFAFGPVDPKEEETTGVEIGNMVREELERVGFAVEWDGTFANRIRVPRILWQRR